MDKVLDRERVVDLLRVLFESCRQIEGKSLKLMPPNADSIHSKGYQIHISPNNDETLESCISRVARGKQLATAMEGNTLIIFNPMKESAA